MLNRRLALTAAEERCIPARLLRDIQEKLDASVAEVLFLLADFLLTLHVTLFSLLLIFPKVVSVCLKQRMRMPPCVIS